MLTQKRILSTALGLMLIIAMAFNFVSCSIEVQAADLMDGVEAKTPTGKQPDEAFTASYADFSLELFKKSITEGKNSLISPLSVMLALAMTANGADTQTKTEMETLLGGGISLEDLNEYLYSYVNSLPSAEKYKLGIANSIWFRDDEDALTVDKDFLQINADYYNASAYKSPFDAQTVKDINNWVKDKTEGMIDNIVDRIDADTIMYLINALVFDAEWATIYEKDNITDGTFTAYNGKERSVEMMSSVEERYIDDGKATGFIKYYKDSKYAFVALLPNYNITLDEYIDTLTGEGFVSSVKNAEKVSVETETPKFSYSYTVTMNDALKQLGMPTAFNSKLADFSKLGSSPYGNIYIGEVLHKTFISVDERGTKAGAVTKVEMKFESCPMYDYTVTLDRPFVYAIIDTSTNLPIFMGTVTDING
ncbi:MAG: serine protease [Clostridia bacterium]|nr:serine protease [Clostridia bacterium]